MFIGGLHSAETGPPEMLMELAYRLAAEESPLYDSIRKNVIVMLTTAAEPDGRDRYVDWYYRYMIRRRPSRSACPARPTGASTSFTTTIATSTTPRSPCATG